MAKTDLNFEVLYEVEIKLARGIELDVIDRAELRKLLRYAEGELYPSQEEYEKHLERLERLDRISYERNPDLYNKILDECNEFEAKYF